MLDLISEMIIMVAHKTEQYENIELDVIRRLAERLWNIESLCHLLN